MPETEVVTYSLQEYFSYEKLCFAAYDILKPNPIMISLQSPDSKKWGVDLERKKLFST